MCAEGPAGRWFLATVGRRDVASRNAYSMRAASLPPLSSDTRSASARAASTYVGSFSSTSAWSGVFVSTRRAVHFSRSGASNAASDAGGTVRFQNVYIPRR